jgi:disulfide bond formation protein DsbB
MITKQCFKKTINYFFTMQVGIATVLLFVSSAALIFALVAEHFWEVKPCVLCMYQRYIMLTIIGAAVIGSVTRKMFFRWIYLIIVLVGFALAGYHVGVEQHWWKGPDSCSTTAPVVDANASKADQIKSFREKIKQQTNTIVRCDQVNWRIFGVSATVWTLAFYIALLGFFALVFVCQKCRKL